MKITRKSTNPKNSIGVSKVPVSTIPSEVIMELGLAMLEGSRKYGRHNYRVAGVRASVYVDALDRHIKAWWEGESVDQESGLSHLIKAIACLVILRDAEFIGNLKDDRPPKLPDGWIKELNKKAKKILETHPMKVPPYTQK